MPEQKCLRCGIGWEVNSNRKANDYCESCRARRTAKVQDCLPWHGKFAEDLLTPIHDDGTPVMLGRRKCGNSDCCNAQHIERAKHGNS